jgi:predicted metal-dependent phosphoesterase TrpH
MTEYLLTELHCHTIYSKDSLTTLEKLLGARHRKGIQRIVITDHNTIAGAVRAKASDPERVIVGEEIMTTAGELLAAYIEEEIPPGLSPLETIDRLRQQGAFISVAHPFDRLRTGHWELSALQEILPLVDAIETFNARNMWPGANRAAHNFAQQNNIPATYGSDAHTPFELGRGAMLLPVFNDALGLKESIRQAVSPRLVPSLPWVHFTSRYAVWRKKFGGNWNK